MPEMNLKQLVFTYRACGPFNNNNNNNNNNNDNKNLKQQETVDISIEMS